MKVHRIIIKCVYEKTFDTYLISYCVTGIFDGTTTDGI